MVSCLCSKAIHTMLKGRQDPSVQVNSGHGSVVFLPPGGIGVTVLSKWYNVSKYQQTFHSKIY